jgi:hypothetical protein
MAEQVARVLGGQLSQPTLGWPSTGGRRRPKLASGCDGRRGFFFGGWGSKWTPAVGVAAPATERRRSASSRATQGEGGNGLEPLSAGTRADKEGHAQGHVGCPGRRISGPNLRPEWVHADVFGQLCLFESSRWAVYSVRTDTFGHEVVEWIGPLEMA